MVILFKGTKKSKNLSPQALALAAGLSATKFLKKTLIIQVTTKYPVEELVMGKRIANEAIKDAMHLFEDTGMDSLTRRVGVTSFTKDHFSNAIIPSVKSENLLDILSVSKKSEADIKREIINNPAIIGSVIKFADNIYDNIFVLANGKDEDVISAISPFVDKTVSCVSQGLKEEIIASKDDYFLVTDFDYRSTFSSYYMKKLYGKRTFFMPYNVEFKEAYLDKNMIQYILHNHTLEKSDYSYHLIDEMTKLTKALILEDEAEEEDLRFTIKTVERFTSKPNMVSGKDVEISLTEKKAFKKPKKMISLKDTPSFKKEGVRA